MPYGYDMETHFRLVSARTRDTQDNTGSAGRIYLNPTENGGQSFRNERSTWRFLKWMKARKPKGKSGQTP